MMRKIDDVNIESLRPLISPKNLKERIPVDEELTERISGFRESVTSILRHESDKMLVITGPCSIHDPAVALDFARRTARIREEYGSDLEVVMRVYFEKPRTSLGWRGFLIDPRLDGSYRLEEGLTEARRLLSQINRLGVPTATEWLDPIVPQYIADLVTWAAIGARTTESQTHRELSSGLSMPIGFKNGTDGSLEKAVNAIESARHSHSFIGIDQEGRTCILKTRGNRATHLIMRGGLNGPNYYEEDIERAEGLLSDIGVEPSILVDCSHANSGKRYDRQSRVFRAVLDMRERGKDSVRGAMLESNIVEGNQPLMENPADLTYGISITDSCIGWDENRELLEKAVVSYAR